MFEQFKNSSKGPLLLSIFPPYRTGFYLVLQCSNGITDQSTVLSGLRALFGECSHGDSCSNNMSVNAAGMSTRIWDHEVCGLIISGIEFDPFSNLF